MMQPWIDNVRTATDGRVDIKILAKGLGHPKAYFDIVKNGMAEFGYTCNNYTPGRFVASEGVEIPFLGDTSEAMSVAYWRTYNKYFIKANEYRGVKLLGVMLHGPGQIGDLHKWHAIGSSDGNSTHGIRNAGRLIPWSNHNGHTGTISRAKNGTQIMRILHTIQNQ